MKELTDGSKIAIPEVTGGATNLVIGLAACINRAGGPAGGEGSEDDVYWYTREACLAIAVAYDIPWMRVMESATHQRGTARPGDVDRWSKDLWPHVMHPSLLVKSVLEA